MSAISIADSFWTDSKIKLNSNQTQLFQSELSRIEQEKLSSSTWSRMFLHSRENRFLFDILRPRVGETFTDWRRRYPDLLEEALYRSSESLALAASEWKSFTDQFFRDRPVLDNPQFVEIQEGLGLYGRCAFERTLRRLKRTAQKKLNVLWDEICERWSKVWQKGRKYRPGSI